MRLVEIHNITEQKAKEQKHKHQINNRQTETLSLSVHRWIKSTDQSKLEKRKDVFFLIQKIEEVIVIRTFRQKEHQI